MAAKDPLTILGDMGEFASKSDVPKLEFRMRVSPSGTFLAGTNGITSFRPSSSKMVVAVSRITFQSVQMSSTVVWAEVTVNLIT